MIQPHILGHLSESPLKTFWHIRNSVGSLPKKSVLQPSVAPGWACGLPQLAFSHYLGCLSPWSGGSPLSPLAPFFCFLHLCLPLRAAGTPPSAAAGERENRNTFWDHLYLKMSSFHLDTSSLTEILFWLGNYSSSEFWRHCSITCQLPRLLKSLQLLW